MKTLMKMMATCLAISMATCVVAQTSMDYNILIEDIEFQTGVTIDININVYVNEDADEWADHGKIFAVEGMAHTANCWKPFAEELFLSAPESAHLNEFYAIDMPGRGGSGFPQGPHPTSGEDFKLADMYFEDYLAVIRGALNYLIDVHGVRPNTIMGHSLGGLEVILFQDMLIREGSNLRKEFGIKNAILLAPAVPDPLPWAFLGAGAGQLIPLAWESPDHGWILDIPFTMWPFLFFTNTCGVNPPNMVPGAPTPGMVLTNGYNSIEAGPILFHMAGLPIAILDPTTHHPTRPRVHADAGIFMPKHGIQLTIFADECDKMMAPAEELALYEYLSGDPQGKGFLLVEGDETCHDTHISDPFALATLLNNPNFFKSAVTEPILPAHPGFTLYPNPVTGASHISGYLTEDTQVTLRAYDMTGREVATLVNRFVAAGEFNLTADLQSLDNGIYLFRFEAGDIRYTKKVVKQ